MSKPVDRVAKLACCVATRRPIGTAAVVWSVLALGCSPAPDASTDVPSSTAAPATEFEPQAAAPAPAAAIELTPVDRAEFDKRIEEFKGKVIVVDFWATWCRPCLEQLPHTYRLAVEHGDQLAVVTCCMEDAENSAAITRALARSAGEANAPVIHLLSNAGGGAAAMEAFDVPGGALPYYRVYDRTGKLRHEFALDPLADEQFTSDDVASAVTALLAE